MMLNVPTSAHHDYMRTTSEAYTYSVKRIREEREATGFVVRTNRVRSQRIIQCNGDLVICLASKVDEEPVCTSVLVRTRISLKRPTWHATY